MSAIDYRAICADLARIQAARAARATGRPDIRIMPTLTPGALSPGTADGWSDIDSDEGVDAMFTPEPEEPCVFCDRPTVRRRHGAPWCLVCFAGQFDDEAPLRHIEREREEEGDDL